MKYEQTKNKVKKLWEKQQNNEVELNNKSNEITKDFLASPNYKKFIVIYESDWEILESYGAENNSSSGLRGLSN